MYLEVINLKYYSIHEFSKLIGRTPQTLRNWDKSGKLKPNHTGSGGYRYYSHQQLKEVLQIKDNSKDKIIIGYCRVSSNKQKDDLQRQIENMKLYLETLNKPYEIISDIGSGINYSKKGESYQKTSNIKKLEKQIKLVHRRLNGIRKNHLHQATNKIVKTKPSKVVMETLNIQGMMKNKHLSKAIQQQGLYEFKRQMQYKCEFNGIEFIECDKWYPSSKTCSECGHIKKNLSLSERTYICEECGCIIDRDLNAAINLSRYSA